MRIILSFSAAHALRDPDGRDGREQAAREQFADAGLKLDTRSCHMVWAGNDPSLARDRVSTSLENVTRRWKDGDLAYTDHEPPNHALHKQFDLSILNTHADLIDSTKFAVPGDNNVSIYGMPQSQWWRPWSTANAMFGLKQLHERTKLGWFGPQFYQQYNVGVKAGYNNLKRALTFKNTCRMIDPNVPVIPFVQDTIRHPSNDRAIMTDATIFDMWANLAWAGIDTVVFWYESGSHNQYAAMHAEQIKRHAEIMPDAIASAFPGGK